MIPVDHPGGGLTAPFVAPVWDLGRLVLEPPGRPLVMGIVNLTPDSFHPGSRNDRCGPAVEHALRLAAEGADLLDLGAESSRPGAEPVGQPEMLKCSRPSSTSCTTSHETGAIWEYQGQRVAWL